MTRKTCPVDQRPFNVFPSRTSQRFCSRACRAIWMRSRRQRKPCLRSGCSGEVVRSHKKFKNAKYCSLFCRNFDPQSALHQAKRDRALMNACRLILKSLQIEAEPTLELVKAVKRVRMIGYHSGWNIVKRKFQRAIARGILIRREERAA